MPMKIVPRQSNLKLRLEKQRMSSTVLIRVDFLLDLRNDLSKLNLKPPDMSNAKQDVINLTTVFNSVFYKYAPTRPMTRKEKRLTDKPWIMRSVLTSIKTKNRLYKKYLKKQQ